MPHINHEIATFHTIPGAKYAYYILDYDTILDVYMV